jgi:enoyl-[acyl-carrier protein] reductase I
MRRAAVQALPRRDARAMFAFQQKHSPLGRGATLDGLGGSALYLLSDLSGGVTGEIHYVDSGYNIIPMPRPEELKNNAESSWIMIQLS